MGPGHKRTHIFIALFMYSVEENASGSLSSLFSNLFFFWKVTVKGLKDAFLPHTCHTLGILGNILSVYVLKKDPMRCSMIVELICLAISG